MLPNIQNPEFELELPSTGELVHYRPFLVKEEKILLVALEGGNASEITNSIYQIIRNCIRPDVTDVMDMTYFDIEYIFLNVRSKSIDNIIKLKLSHGANTECEHQTEYTLDLNNVRIVYPEDHSKKIMINDDVGLMMKYPSLKDQQQIEEDVSSTDVEKVFRAIATCIDNVFDNADVYEDSSVEERVGFLENLTKIQFDKILKFYRTLPSLQHTIEYTCPACHEEESITLRGMQSFFV